MDGTITDSRDAYIEALLEVLDDLGHGRLREEVEGLIVPSILGTVRQVLVEDEVKVRRAVLMIRDEVLQRSDSIALCPGTEDILPRIGGRYLMGLLTGSDRSLVEATLGRRGILGHFDQIATIDLGIEERDQRYEYLLRLLGVEPRETVYIGDTASDVETAKRAGSISIAVYNPHSWSWGSRQELIDSHPDYVIGNLADLAQLLLWL